MGRESMQTRTVSQQIMVSPARYAGLALVAAMSFGRAAVAADGDLDPTFGTGGFTLTGATTVGFELPPKPVVQPDGKIVACSQLGTSGPTGSDMQIARFNADGSPDLDFSFDGKVTIDFANREDGCNALALQPDGKIIAVGTSSDTTTFSGDFAVARLNPDGSLDETFGGGTGQVLVPFDAGGNNGDTAGAVALQSDGRILVAGWAETAPGNVDMAVARLLPDGTRDTTFNSTGRATIPFDIAGALTDQADAVMIDDQGRIILGGVAETQTGSYGFALARLLPNGQLDHNFDADGRATIDFDLGSTNSELSYQSILTRDGKVVMVGNADTGSGTSNLDVAVVRVLPDGSPDPSFGIGGKVVVPFDLVTNGGEVATGVVEDSAGRLAIVGVAVVDSVPTQRSIALRLLRNGDLDESFGNFGKKVYNFDGVTDLFTGIALQGTQLIAAGITSDGTNQDAFVARLEVDLIFANGFE
jgi:uncharacterized delta-60 repeat protein